jgi:hypothetical protein
MAAMLSSKVAVPSALTAPARSGVRASAFKVVAKTVGGKAKTVSGKAAPSGLSPGEECELRMPTYYYYKPALPAPAPHRRAWRAQIRSALCLRRPPHEDYLTWPPRRPSPSPPPPIADTLTLPGISAPFNNPYFDPAGFTKTAKPAVRHLPAQG